MHFACTTYLNPKCRYGTSTDKSLTTPALEKALIPKENIKTRKKSRTKKE